MSCSKNKLKSHLLFTYKNFMFSSFPILYGKKNFAPRNGPDMLQHISFYFPDAMRNQTSNRKYV